MTIPVRTALTRALTRLGDVTLYAVLDAARSPDVLAFLSECFDQPQECASLYSGQTAQTLWQVAPYLVRFSPDDPRLDRFLAQGWGGAWGILLASSAPLPEVRRQLRKITSAMGPDGQTYIVRFYDPRALPALLVTQPSDQGAVWFGAVTAYLIEVPGGIAIYTALDQRRLEPVLP